MLKEKEDLKRIRRKYKKYFSLYRNWEFSLFGSIWGIYYGYLVACTIEAWDSYVRMGETIDLKPVIIFYMLMSINSFLGVVILAIHSDLELRVWFRWGLILLLFFVFILTYWPLFYIPQIIDFFHLTEFDITLFVWYALPGLILFWLAFRYILILVSRLVGEGSKVAVGIRESLGY